MTKLPRPLQNGRLIELLRALDEQHRVMGLRQEGKGSWTLSVHYAPDGSPVLGRVQTVLDVSLDGI
jgi:hypothetical protein